MKSAFTRIALKLFLQGAQLKKLTCILVSGWIVNTAVIAQPVPDINCSPNIFYGAVGSNIHQLQLSAGTVTDLGVFATSPYSSIFSVAYGNDILNNSSNRTLYSSMGSSGASFIIRYNGSGWDTVATDSLVYHNAGGNGRFIYFQHGGGTSSECIARLNSNGTLTKIFFTNPGMIFTVADIAVNDQGNIYCFRGPSIGNTSEITVLDSNGVILNSYSTNLNNLNFLYGCMIVNGTLYLGWGNGFIYPVVFAGSTASFGPPLTAPSGVALKDLANCHELNTGDAEFPLANPIEMVYAPGTGSLDVVNNYHSGLLLKIYDVNGRLLMNEQCVTGSNHYKISITSAGVYLVSLMSDTGEMVYSRKLYMTR